MSYTYTYDRPASYRNPNRLFWQTSLKEAGNVISMLHHLWGNQKGEGKKLWNNRYSQFLKLTSELIVYKTIDRKNQLAMRLMSGIGYAYGNSKVMPYSEQFYIGGSNSVRAFQIRSIGPGSYHPQESEYAYLDQTGDLKLEANVEYRFTSDGIYYLDFIEPVASPLGKYSVQKIGRRTHVTVNDKINCLFQPEIPNIVFINLDEPIETREKLKKESEENYQPWTQVRGELYSALATGGYHNGAFDQIKYDLYNCTNYRKTISMTALPIYWIEPNSRVKIHESTTNTYGDYMISNINYNFGPNSTMTVACSEVFERF
jgi:hypothetical protein